MLNTKKLLYILPDTAYIAELLPTKKEHTFAIQTFRQINGSFLDDNEFIAENVEKLLKKIDPAEYHLILPDFLFTNTIVDVNETSEAGVKKYLKEKLLPSLGLNKETHELDTFILTQHKDKTKVQLSALEKSVLLPIQHALGEHDLTISHISPLSWTIKAIVSLEPSLTVTQLGSMLYLAEHYIGVDQTISFSIEEPENVMEAVKTLKGAEPNIQTLYLLSNQLVETKIKEQLSGTLPIQQLASYSEEDAGIPSHVKQIIETAARTLDISDFPVPEFPLEKLAATEGSTEPEKKLETPETPKLETPVVEAEEMDATLPSPSLPSPSVAPEVKSDAPEMPAETVTEEVSTETKDDATESTEEPEVPAPKVFQKLELSDDDEKMPEPAKAIAATATVSFTSSATPVPSLPTATPAIVALDTPRVEPVNESPAKAILSSIESATAEVKTEVTSLEVKPEPFIESGLSASAVRDIPSSTSTMTENSSPASQPPASAFSYPPANKPERTVIKNKNDAGSLLKIIGVTILALVVTVGIGVGIGVGLLSLSEKKANNLQHSPVTDASPTASPTTAPAPSPSPVAAEVPAKDKLKILIVNATTTAGKAGKFKTSLQQAGYKSIETGNAKGTYAQKGMYLLGPDASGAINADFAKALGVTLTSQTDKTTEDPKAAFDVVVVIAE